MKGFDALQIVIRADASTEIGTGHVMRCLTLADKFRRNGAMVQFVCREHPGHLCDLIQQMEYPVLRLPYFEQKVNEAEGAYAYSHWLGVPWEEDLAQTSSMLSILGTAIDLLIVDHYAIDIRWEQNIRSFVNKIMIVDDLANRHHDCDILLDQNLYNNMENRYDGMIPEYCMKFLGPSYALLRDEFQVARTFAQIREKGVRRILAFFGGSDPTNETQKALEAFILLEETELKIDVVVGSSNPNKAKIAELCSKLLNAEYYCQTNQMAELMVHADLAIGAGGSTTWERCFLGLPAITITTADNQIEVTEVVASRGAIQYLGHYSEVSPPTIAIAIKKYCENPGLLADISRTGMEIMGQLDAVDAVSVVSNLLNSVK
ncbi:UDP-2,4-diacetamido-2,4,6-trideoxy-beta-L-altropyranose hydrolase [Paenibacillus chondroitinus]|uniref:UDP-2,4-diacetamido-2,4, 6-trideoxy-beta-L-altropyranose hydrolase n=1 Tax=Paenibacillus chondroitinus TaxID=59842 RepID=A0ABU6DCW1_9BACL|nr:MULTISPECIES: UDP-2,4-diacetamido-2,4,6-trideoxy-beta-L-altropyranose hydrolase [Paenibacillus]MCY9660516.1 UDP-2,4-diacetamido-2,4,6-trideoxy-beta-L-altropyranose hydrolase [Paenibacillus anseongense]MEB4795127.1 UDP-2,4-diacetamido-2,4,6-trideoxy-beta-L-altropyranose hydrolase [Paenibacillus chondroitinus]